MPRTYDSEFRRRVIELLRVGRSVAAVAADLDLAEATVYRWKAQDLIDRGERDGPSSSERGELAAARLWCPQLLIPDGVPAAAGLRGKAKTGRIVDRS